MANTATGPAGKNNTLTSAMVAGTSGAPTTTPAEFYRGGYVPREYRMRAFEVDYREHHLQRPPQGQRWVQVGADYVLIAIATGVIANIILSR